jgi:hypothetical protein
MLKPYQLTRQGRYLGLPLGFAFLGVASAVAAFTYSPLLQFFLDSKNLSIELLWPTLLTKTFAFVFIATTYLFAGKKTEKRQLLWEITISLLVIALAILLLLVFVAPQFAFAGYSQSNVYLRVFNVACLAYVVFVSLRSHLRNPEPMTIWIPFGFIFLAISQYTLLFWYLDSSLSAFVGSLVVRFIGLTIFLFVAIRTFYGSDEKDG